MPETFYATAGLAATLDAVPTGPDHHLRTVHGCPPDVFGVCTCGHRIDGADHVQVVRLHEAHRGAL